MHDRHAAPGPAFLRCHLVIETPHEFACPSGLVPGNEFPLKGNRDRLSIFNKRREDPRQGGSERSRSRISQRQDLQYLEQGTHVTLVTLQQGLDCLSCQGCELPHKLQVVRGRNLQLIPSRLGLEPSMSQEPDARMYLGGQEHSKPGVIRRDRQPGARVHLDRNAGILITGPQPLSADWCPAFLFDFDAHHLIENTATFYRSNGPAARSPVFVREADVQPLEVFQKYKPRSIERASLDNLGFESPEVASVRLWNGQDEHGVAMLAPSIPDPVHVHLLQPARNCEALDLEVERV